MALIRSGNEGTTHCLFVSGMVIWEMVEAKSTRLWSAHNATIALGGGLVSSGVEGGKEGHSPMKTSYVLLLKC